MSSAVSAVSAVSADSATAVPALSALSALTSGYPGLLRALFFGEKCATCVQFVECAGVRSICCVSIKYEFLFDKSRKISINIM